MDAQLRHVGKTMDDSKVKRWSLHGQKGSLRYYSARVVETEILSQK